MHTDEFILLFAKSIHKRFLRQKGLNTLKITINEVQIRELESMYMYDGYLKSQAIYNDVLCDVLEVLNIDYEVSLRSGLKIKRNANE